MNYNLAIIIQLHNNFGGFIDSYNNIDLKELLASAALEDEELAEKLSHEGADKLTFQKIEWKADEEVGGFERELVGIYV